MTAAKTTKPRKKIHVTALQSEEYYDGELSLKDGALHITGTDKAGTVRSGPVSETLNEGFEVTITLKKAGAPTTQTLPWHLVAALLASMGDVSFECGATCIGKT